MINKILLLLSILTITYCKNILIINTGLIYYGGMAFPECYEDCLYQHFWDDELSINNLFNISSGGKFTLDKSQSQIVITELQYEMSIYNCDATALMDLILDKVRSIGFEPNNYKYQLIIIPSYTRCGWRGAARNIGCYFTLCT